MYLIDDFNEFNFQGHKNVCELILKDIVEKQGDKSPRTNNGRTPLHYAAENGQLNVVKFFLKNLDLKEPMEDNNRRTPMNLSIINKHSEVQKAFLEAFKKHEKVKKEGVVYGKKRKTKRKESYAIYIYKVLKHVHPDIGVSSKAMTIMNSFINDLFERIAAEASKLAKNNKR